MLRLNPPFPNYRINALGWVGSDLYLSYRRNKYQNDFIIISNFEIIIAHASFRYSQMIGCNKKLRFCDINVINPQFFRDTKIYIPDTAKMNGYFSGLKLDSHFKLGSYFEFNYKPAHNWYPRARKDNTFKKHNRRWNFGEKVYAATTAPDQLTMTVFTENSIFIVDVGE